MTFIQPLYSYVHNMSCQIPEMFPRKSSMILPSQNHWFNGPFPDKQTLAECCAILRECKLFVWYQYGLMPFQDTLIVGLNLFSSKTQLTSAIRGVNPFRQLSDTSKTACHLITWQRSWQHRPVLRQMLVVAQEQFDCRTPPMH